MNDEKKVTFPSGRKEILADHLRNTRIEVYKVANALHVDFDSMTPMQKILNDCLQEIQALKIRAGE